MRIGTIAVIAIALFLCLSLLDVGASSPPPTSTLEGSTNNNLAVELEINSVISPAIQDYLERGINLAEKENAKFIILKLNTPGGLESAMRGINQAIIQAKIPVILYVAPAGARAASAGTFMAYASNKVAMAPGTNIGAASPINLLAKNSQDTAHTAHLTTEQKKAVNDAAAYMRSLAQLRGKNAEWGESAVRNSASASAEEAVKLKVADMIADNEQELLNKLDGQTVTVKGVTQTLDTKNLNIKIISPGWRYQFLSFITDPNITFLLLLIAIYGLFFEFSNPGLVLPGVFGVIALILVLYAFQIMPVNYTGLTLLLIGIVFMVCEVFISSFGVLGIGGIIAFIVGSIMLFDFNDPQYKLTWPLIVLMCILTLTFFFIVLNLAIRSHKKAIVTGSEGLVGSEGVVLDVENEQTIVRVFGEIWDAKAEHALNRGQRVKVIGVSGLTLRVEPIGKSHSKRENL